MLTRQVLESQRKQSKQQVQSWAVEVPLPQLWAFASAWLRHRAALAKPAPSLRYPGWITGELPWAGPRPWLELPFCWQEEKRFRIEHSAGPQAYVCWEIHCEAVSPRQSRLSLRCNWHWKQAAVLSQRWQALCHEITAALPALHRLFKYFPVQNLQDLSKAGHEILSLWGHLEPSLVRFVSGASPDLIWEWFHNLSHAQDMLVHWAHVPSRTLLDTPEQWTELSTGHGLALLLYPEGGARHIKWPLSALKHQIYLWPHQDFALQVPGREAVPWQHQHMAAPCFLARDPLAKAQRHQSLDKKPTARYQWLHPKGKQHFSNTGKAPELLAYGHPRQSMHRLESWFTDANATPYLLPHWPDNHPLTLHLSLCLVSTAAEHHFAAGLAGTIESQLTQGRLLLSSAQGILLAFAHTQEALSWLHHFYAQAPAWERWGLLSEGFIPQISVSEGPVNIYPQQAHWRVMGNQVRTLNEGVNQSQGGVVMEAELLAKAEVLKTCQQQQWNLHYVPAFGTVHLTP